MHSTITKRIFALALVAVLALSLTACNNADAEVSEVDESDKVYATAGGQITLPEDLEIPGENNTMTKQLIEGTNILAGAFSLTNYRTSGYYYTSGNSLTVTVNASLDNVTKYTDACMTLWVKGDGYTEFLGVVYFTADGTPQTYTWSGLTPNTQYKVNFTYTTIPSYLMTGTFNIDGFASEATEETAVVAE